MKKVILLWLIMLLLLTGCSKVSYLSEYPGVPIYPGTEYMLSNESDNQVTVQYGDMSFNGDIEKVRKFFERNIDKDIWTMEESKYPFTGHNVEKVYGYDLKSKGGNATLTMAYINSDKVGESIIITVIGDKLK